MKVGVLGAGAVGAYVGGLVQARSGLEPPVVLVGRQRLVDQTARGGAVLQTVGSAHPQVNIAARDLKGRDDQPVLATSTTTTRPEPRAAPN